MDVSSHVQGFLQTRTPVPVQETTQRAVLWHSIDSNHMPSRPYIRLLYNYVYVPVRASCPAAASINA